MGISCYESQRRQFVKRVVPKVVHPPRSSPIPPVQPTNADGSSRMAGSHIITLLKGEFSESGFGFGTGAALTSVLIQDQKSTKSSLERMITRVSFTSRMNAREGTPKTNGQSENQHDFLAVEYTQLGYPREVTPQIVGPLKQVLNIPSAYSICPAFNEDSVQRQRETSSPRKPEFASPDYLFLFRSVP
ncbi:hypothetical protein FA13DRAFT_1714864 [Coprinellus micaceus]|uniref:Uncharacterized protein n=1 Tax=Coprinellus micaceus TaxID=71717 RepID=A0A4Y7SS62_COPMI|nr:hypothetical protein FA13DRAFT_1714864 [Coprinellus micaceus]